MNPSAAKRVKRLSVELSGTVAPGQTWSSLTECISPGASACVVASMAVPGEVPDAALVCSWRQQPPEAGGGWGEAGSVAVQVGTVTLAAAEAVGTGKFSCDEECLKLWNGERPQCLALA